MYLESKKEAQMAESELDCRHGTLGTLKKNPSDRGALQLYSY